MWLISRQTVFFLSLQRFRFQFDKKKKKRKIVPPPYFLYVPHLKYLPPPRKPLAFSALSVSDLLLSWQQDEGLVGVGDYLWGWEPRRKKCIPYVKLGGCMTTENSTSNSHGSHRQQGGGKSEEWVEVLGRVLIVGGGSGHWDERVVDSKGWLVVKERDNRGVVWEH